MTQTQYTTAGGISVCRHENETDYAGAIDRLIVDWPGGGRQVFTHLAADHIYTITEDDLLEQERYRFTSREHLILDERLLSDSPVTLSSIGNRLNISRERARQLEAKLKDKLRKIFLKAFDDKSSILCTG